MCHFTINVIIDIMSSCYASEHIPYTYLNYNYVFIKVNIFSLLGYLGKKQIKMRKKVDGVNLYNDSPPTFIRCH